MSLTLKKVLDVLKQIGYNKNVENQEEGSEMALSKKTEDELMEALSGYLVSLVQKISAAPTDLQDKHLEIAKIALSKVANQVDKDVQYNSAFDKAVDLFGDMYLASKIYEKCQRIIHLTQGNQSSFESLEDSLLDCAGYCLLGVERLNRPTAEPQAEPTPKLKVTMPQL
jgi:hypothetical protein